MPAASEICWHSPQGVTTLREILPGIGDLLSYSRNITRSAFVHVFRAVRSPLLLQFPLFISYLTGTVVLSRQVNRSGPEADHLHLAPSLRMSGAIPLLPLCALTASTGTVVQLYLHRDVFRYLTEPSCCGPSENSALNFNSDSVFGRMFPINIGYLNIEYTASRAGRQ